MSTLLTPDMAAAELSVSRTIIYRLIGDGRLSSIKIGRSRRIPRASLDAFIASTTEEQTELAEFDAHN